MLGNCHPQHKECGHIVTRNIWGNRKLNLSTRTIWGQI